MSRLSQKLPSRIRQRIIHDTQQPNDLIPIPNHPSLVLVQVEGFDGVNRGRNHDLEICPEILVAVTLQRLVVHV
jgi:hypothetical protein